MCERTLRQFGRRSDCPEGLWGDSATLVVAKLRECTGELVARVGEYMWVENPKPAPWAMVDRSEKRVSDLRAVVFALNGEDDAYSKALREAVAQVRTYVKHHLRT